MLSSCMQMMKQWGEARQRVAEMKVIDPKGAVRLEQEVTEVSRRSKEWTGVTEVSWRS